jgi:chemotaxis protein MotB
MQMTRYVVLPTLLAAVAFSAGCVSRSKYDALEARLKTAEDELGKRGKAIDELNTNLKSESEKAQDLSKKASTLEQKASTLEQTVSAVRKDKSALEGSLNQVQTDNDRLRLALAELEKTKAETEKRVAEYQNLLSKFKTLIDSGKLNVRIIDGRMVVALNSDLLFRSGSSMLTADGQKAVQEVAALLQSIPEKKYQVEGHTDNVAIKSDKFASNWELAAARAISVVKKMVDAGMPDERISAASYGEAKPAVPNDTKEGRAANRRVEIVVVPDLSKLPGFDALRSLDKKPQAAN